MQEDSFGSNYVNSFMANTILRLLKLASPIPTTPPTQTEPKSPTRETSKIPFDNIDVEVANEQKDDLTFFNINDKILDGFQKVQEQPSKEPKEIKKEEKPILGDMESLEVAKEHMEKPKEIHNEKEPLAKFLDQSQAQPKLES